MGYDMPSKMVIGSGQMLTCICRGGGMQGLFEAMPGRSHVRAGEPVGPGRGSAPHAISPKTG